MSSVTIEDQGIVNSIIWGNSAPQWGEFYADYIRDVPQYCCIRGWPLGGEGNIWDDPLFANGPERYFYLSSTDAGQDVRSPCIDAGNLPSDYWRLNNLTVRTDHARDGGVVDMGFHYPTELTPASIEVKCTLNTREFQAGDTILVSLEAENLGSDVSVDVSLAFFPGLTTSEQIYYISPEGVRTRFSVWMTDLLLPRGFVYGPEVVLQVEIPRYAGYEGRIYKCVVLLNHAGTLQPICASIIGFEVL